MSALDLGVWLYLIVLPAVAGIAIAVSLAVDVAHDRQTRRTRAELAARHGWTMP